MFFPVTQFYPVSLNFILLRSSSTLNLCFVNVKGKVSQTYKATRKIIIYYILIFTFLDHRCEDRSYFLYDSKLSLNLNCSQFFRKCIFQLLLSAPNIKCSHIFEAFISCFYTKMLSCSLVPRQE